MAHRHLVVHGDDRPVPGPSGICGSAKRITPSSAAGWPGPREPARVVAIAGIGERLVERLAGGQVWRAKPLDRGIGELSPALRLTFDAVDRIGVPQDLRKLSNSASQSARAPAAPRNGRRHGWRYRGPRVAPARSGSRRAATSSSTPEADIRLARAFRRAPDIRLCGQGGSSKRRTENR